MFDSVPLGSLSDKDLEGSQPDWCHLVESGHDQEVRLARLRFIEGNV